MTTATISANTRRMRGAVNRDTRFANTLASEWLKLATLRSTYFTLGLGYLLSVATSAIVGIALGSTRDTWSGDISPITASMVGTVFGLIVYSVFGVLTVSREYASGTMRLTLTATPNRRQVFLAKLTLVTAIVTVAGVATTVSMFAISQAVFSATGMPTASFTDGDALHMVLGLGLAMPFFPIMGMAFGMLLRSTAGGITTALGLLWLPQIFGEFVPTWFQEHILSLLPSNGIDSVTVSHIESTPAYSAPLLGAAIAAAWLLASVGAAYIAFQRRDA